MCWGLCSAFGSGGWVEVVNADYQMYERLLVDTVMGEVVFRSKRHLKHNTTQSEAKN